MSKRYLMTKVFLCDRDGDHEPKEIAGLEISAVEWADIVGALDYHGTNAPYLYRKRGLATDIEYEILSAVPEELV